MKICILGDANSIHVQRIGSGLAERGHRVRVVSHKAGDVPGATVERWRVPQAGLRYPARWDRRRVMHLRRIMRGHDLVHVNFLHDWTLTEDIAACGRLVVSPWGSDIVKPPPLEAYPDGVVASRRALLRAARTVLVYGRTFVEPVRAFADLPRSKVHSVPLGVNTQLFRPVLPYCRRARTIGFFKGFRPVYAPTVLIHALPGVLGRFPDARVELAGCGPLRDECRRLARKLGVSDRLEWLDGLPHPELARRLGQWSVTVIPSVFESFCVAALESAAAQTPVVASRVGGLVETVRDRVTGVLVPPNDPGTLAAALAAVLEDTESAARLGQAGRAFVRRHYEWSTCLDQLMDVYELTCDASPAFRSPLPFGERGVSSRSGQGTERSSLEWDCSPAAFESKSAKPRPAGRVLMIAAAFPPTGGPGVQRSAKFAKYLPRFGWQPVVWASRPWAGLPEDHSLLDDLPRDVVIQHAPDGLRDHMREWFPFTTGNGSRFSSWVARLARIAHRGQPHGHFPDDLAGWAGQSLSPLMEVIESYAIEAIYSTFSPASNHVLALTLKRRTGLPWVADFRDLWTEDYRYRETSATMRAAHRLLEQEMLENADVVIGATPAQTGVLAQHVPGVTGKVITITNGFDPPDFEGIKRPAGRADAACRTDDVFVMAHVGRFDRWRALDGWYAGLKTFVQSSDIAHRRFVFRVVGHADATTRRRLEETGARCEFIGYVSHRKAIEEMCHATALLLSVPQGPNADTVMPAKLFEYLAACRPILVVGPPNGACNEIVESSNAGVCVPFDAAAIGAALMDLYDRWQRGRLPAGCAAEHLEPFSRVALTARLAAALDGLTGRDRGTHPQTGRMLEAVAS